MTVRQQMLRQTNPQLQPESWPRTALATDLKTDRTATKASMLLILNIVIVGASTTDYIPYVFVKNFTTVVVLAVTGTNCLATA